MRVVPTSELSPHELRELKAMLEEAYGEPLVEDWDHALGGTHVLIEENGRALAHASVVERRLETGGRVLRTGYVEAVATRPGRRREGLATRIMEAATAHVLAGFELGGLCTGENSFYERFGWETWRGPTFVRTERARERTPEEDGNVMILRTPSTPALDLGAAISCEWRTGDAW